MEKLQVLYFLRKLYWNFHSLTWDEFLFGSGYAEEIEQIVEISITHLNRKNPSLLDIGCATGSYSIAFAKKKSTVIGIDYAKKMIRKAEQKVITLGLKDVTFLVNDFNRGLNFKNAQFDIVVTAHIFRAVEDVSSFTNEITRILNEDGLLLVVSKKMMESRNAVSEKNKNFSGLLLKGVKPLIFPGQKKQNIDLEKLRIQIESSGLSLLHQSETLRNNLLLFKKHSLRR